MEPVTRRRFLQSVGVGGGAGALFATMGALGLAPPLAFLEGFGQIGGRADGWGSGAFPPTALSRRCFATAR
jgi:hypothetical protein